MTPAAAIASGARSWTGLVAPSTALLYAAAAVLAIADTPVGTGYPDAR